MIEAFASFGFCKAHAAAFALPTYQSAWLKAHYPAHFISGVLTHDPGMYPKRLILDDARQLGIAVLGLDVNASEAAYVVEKLADTTPDSPFRAPDEVAAAKAVDAIHVHLGQPLLVGPGRTHAVDRQRVLARQAVFDDLASGHEVEPAVVDDERRREYQKEMRPKPARRTTRMYSSSAIRRSRPFRTGKGSDSVSDTESCPEGSEPTGLTVDVIPYSSA